MSAERDEVRTVTKRARQLLLGSYNQPAHQPTHQLTQQPTLFEGQAQDSNAESALYSGVQRAIDELAEANALVGAEPQIYSAALQSLRGFGELQGLLDDPDVEEIWMNRPEEIHYWKSGSVFQVPSNLNQADLQTLVFRMLKHSGRKLDRARPYVDAPMQDGSRLHVIIPDVTAKHWALNIRKFRPERLTLETLTAMGSITLSQAQTLSAAMAEGKSILVSGATGAGKTTLLSALLHELPASERLISAEDTLELNLDHKDWVAMQTRPVGLEGAHEISLRELVRQALRMRPSRLVIGEVRGAECLDLLIALNSGIPGLCTLHANSAKAAIQKLLTLPLLAGDNITSAFLRPAVVGAFDLIVHCRRDPDGRRRVSELLEITDDLVA